MSAFSGSVHSHVLFTAACDRELNEAEMKRMEQAWRHDCKLEEGMPHMEAVALELGMVITIDQAGQKPDRSGPDSQV